MSYNKTLWVDTSNRRLIKSFQSNTEANKPKFAQGDTVPVQVILLEETGNDGTPYRNIKVTTETLKLALGRVDQAAASGTFTLTFDGDTTSALNYNVSAADLQTALNALASITSAGGVTVTGNDGGPFTVAFVSNGARNYITADLVLLEPSSNLSNTRKQTGDGSTKEIQVLRIAEGVLALQTSFSAISAPTAAISTLVTGGSGANEIQQLIIDQECIGGLIALTFGAESTSFNYGATAAEVKTSLESNTNIAANNIAVTKVSDLIYTFEFIGTLADADQAAFTVDYSGLEGFSGFSGDLDLDNYSVESFLSGSDNGDCKLEIELSAGANKTTLVKTDAVIDNDIINSATSSPPLSPSVTFVESINGDAGVVTGYYKSGGTDVAVADGGTGASSASVARTNLGLVIGTDIQAHSAVLDATTASFTTADETKLDNIEALADVTDATSVDAAGAVMNSDTTTASMSFVIDEDNMASDSATKVPTQQSVKAYVDASGGGVYRNIYIDAAAMIPRDTNGAAPLSKEFATNDIMVDYLAFDSTTEEGAQFKLMMPDEWDRGTIKVKFYWDAAATASGTCIWGVSAGSYSDSDPIDAALGTQITVTDTLLTVGDVHISPAAAAVTVGGTPSLEDLIIFQIVATTGGTIAVDQFLMGVSIQYKESTTTPVIW